MDTMRSRRLGLSRSAAIQPLHPHASDSTISKKKGRGVSEEKDICDLPDSSSSDSSEDDDTCAAKVESGDNESDDFLPGPSPKRRKLGHNKLLESSASLSRKAEPLQEDEDDPFKGIGSSQKSNRAGNRCYGKKSAQSARERNKAIAKKNNKIAVDAVGPPKEKQDGFKAPPKIEFAARSDPSTSNNGFRLPYTANLKSLGKSSTRDGFKVPIAEAKQVIEAVELMDHEAVRPFRQQYASTSSVTQSPSATSTLSTPLSSPTSEHAPGPSLGFEACKVDDETDASPPTLRPCPICGKDLQISVYDQLVEEIAPSLSSGANKTDSDSAPRLNMRQQARFCRRHREDSGREEWKKRRYPQIEWAALADRVRKMEPDLIKMIDSGSQSSLFLKRLSKNSQGDAPRSSKGRQKPKTTEKGRRQRVAAEVGGSMGAEDVGYYGGRGSRCIGEVLVETFAGRFRNAEGKTQQAIASAGGVTRFIERVLVPEVVVKLIMQDLRCNVGKARKVLVQSADLGKLLCEEENDEVEDDELEEDELENLMTDDEALET